jgi:hypothetical protein
MAATDIGDVSNEPTPAPSGTPARRGIWQSVKRGLTTTETDFAFVKGLTFIGFLGTIIVGYFQYLSAYQDKVAAQAKDDLAAATSAFTETSTALSVPLSLQERIVYSYYDAVNQKLDTDDNAYVTKSARAIYAAYEDSYTSLREHIDLLARKTEIYIDWASDFGHDPNANNPAVADPINVSLLSAYNFDCDKDMPFADGKTNVQLKDKKGNVLTIDWYSAKHHVVTMGYCLDDTNKLVEPVRQWASNSSVNAARKADLLDPQKIDLMGRLNNQELRLNAYMSLTMDAIDQIRLKYQPNGFFCHVPVVREAIGIFSRACTPVQTSQ